MSDFVAATNVIIKIQASITERVTQILRGCDCIETPIG